MPKWPQSATITSKNMFIRTFLFFNRNYQKREFKLYYKPFYFFYHLSPTIPHTVIHRTRRQGDR